MKLRELLVDQLRQAGVDVIFGVMGDGNMHLLLDAVERAGIRFVNARHETAAVLMADGYARRAGRPCVATMTHGPGLAAAGLGIKVAASAGSPVLVLAGDTARASYSHVQRLDQSIFTHGLGVAQFGVAEGAGAAARVQQALNAVVGGGGLRVLHLPVDLQEAECEALPTSSLQACAVLRSARTQLIASEADVAKLAQRLSSARRPLLLAGAGARAAASSLQALAVRCGALLGTTVPAHGLFGNDAQAVGIVGGLTLPAQRAQLDAVDLVVAFGASLSRFTTDFGRLAPQADWVLVTHDRQVEPSVPLCLAVLGDTQDVAQRLLARLDSTAHPGLSLSVATSNPSEATPLPFSEVVGAPRVAPQVLSDFATRGMDPRRLAQAVQALLPPDRTEVIGVGHFGGFPLQYSRLTAAGRLLAPWEFGAIGVSVPIALGAALAHPQAWTVAWEGDGSLLASLGELETLARSGARVLVLVVDDGAYTAEVRKLAEAGRATNLAEFGRRDLAGVARSLGLPAWAVDDLADLPAVITAALATEGPAFVQLAIDGSVHQQVF